MTLKLRKSLRSLHSRIRKTRVGGGLPTQKNNPNQALINPSLKKLKTKVTQKMGLLTFNAYAGSEPHAKRALKTLQKKSVNIEAYDKIKDPFDLC